VITSEPNQMTDLDKLVAYIRRTLTDLNARMEIATEMAKLVLQMRGNGRNAGVTKQRLELLAEHFLRIAGQEDEPDSAASIQNASRTPGGVTRVM
jgi:hypothetical protein